MANNIVLTLTGGYARPVEVESSTKIHQCFPEKTQFIKIKDRIQHCLTTSRLPRYIFQFVKSVSDQLYTAQQFNNASRRTIGLQYNCNTTTAPNKTKILLLQLLLSTRECVQATKHRFHHEIQIYQRNSPEIDTEDPSKKSVISLYQSLLSPHSYRRHMLRFSFTFAFTFPVERVRDIYSAVSTPILMAQVLLHETCLQCLLRCGTFSHVCTNHKRLRVDVVA